MLLSEAPNPKQNSCQSEALLMYHSRLSLKAGRAIENQKDIPNICLSRAAVVHRNRSATDRVGTVQRLTTRHESLQVKQLPIPYQKSQPELSSVSSRSWGCVRFLLTPLHPSL